MFIVKDHLVGLARNYLPIKLALIIFAGKAHAGIGETQVNNLLSSTNIAPIHPKTLKRTEGQA